MPLYIYEAAYTAESLAAQIREPQDRLEATRTLYDALPASLSWPPVTPSGSTTW